MDLAITSLFSIKYGGKIVEQVCSCIFFYKLTEHISIFRQYIQSLPFRVAANWSHIQVIEKFELGQKIFQIISFFKHESFNLFDLV